MPRKTTPSEIPKYLKGLVAATDQDEAEVDRLAAQVGRYYRRLRAQGVPADFAKSIIAAWYCKKTGAYVPWGDDPEFEDE